MRWGEVAVGEEEGEEREERGASDICIPLICDTKGKVDGLGKRAQQGSKMHCYDTWLVPAAPRRNKQI